MLVAAAGLVRLVVAALVPVVPDEAYYWDWSRHLAAGYFDHPGAIAWLIRAGTIIAGTSSLGVRLGVVVAGTVATLAVLAWARRLGGDRAAWYAAMVIVAMPLAGAGLLLATPDVPLLLTVAVGLWALDHALETDRLLWWAATGLALGAGGDAKYTAVLVPAAVAVALLVRGRLFRRGPLVAAVMAAVAVTPVIWWNATHGWISFAFQFQHGLVPKGHTGPLARELSLLGGQLGLVTPILFALLATAVWRGLSRTASERVFVPAVVAVGVAAFFVWSALRHAVEPNWPAPALLPAIVIYAAAARARLGRWDRAGIVLAGVVLVLIYAQGIVPFLPIRAKADPIARGAGWDQLSREVAAVRGSASVAASWVAGNRYQDAAELAFHLADHPMVFSLGLGGRPSQYNLWPGFPERARPGDALVLVLDDDAGTPGPITALLPCFTSIVRGEAVDLMRGGQVVTRRRIWQLGGWRGTWPTQSVLPGASPAPVSNSGTITLSTARGR
ncbi:MAG TPA: glycosyltransferase family 39 protein [Gemmatimonadaceae bacterium]|nr:glycosyltransferase family 39 protein [Gemmatimonadaceae bacterium]